MHCTRFPTHYVHVLHLPRTGCSDAHHVVCRKLEPNYLRIIVIWCLVDSHRQFRSVEVAHVLVALA